MAISQKVKMSDFKNWRYIFGNISTALRAIGIDLFTHAIERGVLKTLEWNFVLGPKFLKKPVLLRLGLG